MASRSELKRGNVENSSRFPVPGANGPRETPVGITGDDDPKAFLALPPGEFSSWRGRKDYPERRCVAKVGEQDRRGPYCHTKCVTSDLREEQRIASTEGTRA